MADTIRDSFEAGAMLLAYIGLINTAFISKDAEKRDYSHHQKELECLLKQHNEEIKLTKETYMQNMIVDMERHFQQLNADLLSATRASERDMYDQRNKQCQTLILASTIMLSTLISIIIQGRLPSDSPSQALLLFSVSSTASLGSLFLCIIIYILLVIRCSKFMYRKRSKEYTKQFSEATKATKFMFDQHSQVLTNRSKDSWEEKSYDDDIETRVSFKKSFFEKLSKKFSKIKRISKTNDKTNDIKEADMKANQSIIFSNDDFVAVDMDNSDSHVHIDFGQDTDNGIFGQVEDAQNSFYKLDEDAESYGLLSTPPNNPYETPRRNDTIRKKIFDLDLPVLEQEYLEHDKIIRSYLQRRDRINRNYTKFLFGVNTFDNYWNNNCHLHHQVGVILFYVGTGLLLLCLITYNWVFFTYSYLNSIAAIASTVIIGAALILGILFRFSFKIVQSKTTTEWEKLIDKK